MKRKGNFYCQFIFVHTSFMIFLVLFFIPSVYSITEDDPNIDKIFFQPQILSDFVNAKQLRNLTISGQNEITPVNGAYFTKIMFDLMPSLNPTMLTFQSMFFTNFDGLLFNGESKSLAKFADLFIYDCSFTHGRAQIMTIHGPPKPNQESQDP